MGGLGSLTIGCQCVFFVANLCRRHWYAAVQEGATFYRSRMHKLWDEEWARREHKAGTQLQHMPVFVSNADFTFAGEHPAPRFAQGAFVRCLEALYDGVCKEVEESGGPPATPLQIERFGKPFAVTYEYAEMLLADEYRRLRPAHARAQAASSGMRIFAVGDNPRSDVRGANGAGDHWTSVLVRTGVYDGGALRESDTPDMCVDDVGAAVDWMLAEAGLAAD